MNHGFPVLAHQKPETRITVVGPGKATERVTTTYEQILEKMLAQLKKQWSTPVGANLLA
jgi:hypothetical protein